VTQQIWSTTGTQIAGNLSVVGTITGAVNLDGQITIIGTSPVTFGVSAQNLSTGPSASAGFVAINDAGNITQINMTGTGYSTYPLAGPRAGLFYADGPGGLVLNAAGGAGNIRFAAGGATEQMRLATTGNFGIGTDAPAYRLHVLGNDGILVQTPAGVSTLISMVASATAQWDLQATTSTGTWILRSASAGLDVLTAGFNGTVELRAKGPDVLVLQNALLSSISASGFTNIWMGDLGSGVPMLQASKRGVNVRSLILNCEFGFSSPSKVAEFFNQDIEFYTNGTERFRIDVNGYIGIGTDTPQSLLHLRQFASTNVDTLTIQNGNNDAAGDAVSLVFKLAQYQNPTETNKQGFIRLSGAGGTFNQSADLLFGTPSGAAPAERMRITSVGNVGIGTGAPTGKLTVITAAGSINTGAWDATAVVIGPNGASPTGGNLALGYNTVADHAQIYALAPSVAWKFLDIYTGETAFFIQGAERVRFDSGGNAAFGGGGNVSYAATRRVSINDATSSELVLAVGGVPVGTMYAAASLFQLGAQNGTVMTFVVGAATRLEIATSGVTRNTQATGTFNLGLDPGATAASIPIGGIIGGTAAGAGYTGLAPLATITLSGSDTITMNGFSTSTVLTSGTYRLLNRITAQECMFIRVA
jgi:hypothetical protein